MTVDEYLRSCKGVPPLPASWRWEIYERDEVHMVQNIPTRTKLYDVYIIDEYNEVLNYQTLEPWNKDIANNKLTINEDFLTVIRGTYYSLFLQEKPDLLHTMTLRN